MSSFGQADYNMSYEPTAGTDFSHPSLSCSQGHRSSLQLSTQLGGSICLLCFTNLISNPNSPTVHISYALSQLTQAVSHLPFLQTLRQFHSHLLISPLAQLLSNCNDEPIARQTIEIVTCLCCGNGDGEVLLDFVARIADRICSGALSWSRRQIYSVRLIFLLNFRAKTLDRKFE